MGGVPGSHVLSFGVPAMSIWAKYRDVDGIPLELRKAMQVGLFEI